MIISEKKRILSLLLKIVVALSAAVGVLLSAAGSEGSFMSGSTVFMYFTIQSNLAIAFVCAGGIGLVLKKSVPPRRWFVVKFVFTVSITLTGTVFCFILAPTMGSHAWNVQNVLTHVVVPVAAIADFFLTGVMGEFKKSDVFFVTIPPLAYAAYAGIAYAAGWKFAFGVSYPYFFLNWGIPAGAFGFSKELPFIGVVWWMILLSGLIIGVGYLYLAIIARLKRRAEAAN